MPMNYTRISVEFNVSFSSYIYILKWCILKLSIQVLLGSYMPGSFLVVYFSVTEFHYTQHDLRARIANF